jgi:hypothetical protein
MPKITNGFILITPNCDWGADNSQPGPHADILDNEYLLAWFLQNIDREPSDKLIPIPIGLANKKYPHGNTSLVHHYSLVGAATPRNQRNNLAYMNFAPGTNFSARLGCYNHFIDVPFVKVGDRKPYSGYLEDMTQSKFVISPPGNGVDCHRTWEALLMGCYPIVKSTTLNPLYKDLPIIIADDWSEITEELLNEKEIEFSNKSWSYEKIYAPYWFDRVKAIQYEARNVPMNERFYSYNTLSLHGGPITPEFTYRMKRMFGSHQMIHLEADVDILDQIAAKLSTNNQIILIENIRRLHHGIENQYLAMGYPSIQMIQTLISEIAPDYELYILGDMALAFSNQLNIKASPLVKAITTSFLYADGDANESDLIEAEKVLIENPYGYEATQIDELYRLYNTDEIEITFHLYIWKGLQLLGQNKREEAKRVFEDVLDAGYEHWRISWYLDQTAR